MLDTTTSSQGSKAALGRGALLGAGAGVSSPELETVPLPTPPYVDRLPPPSPRRRRPGATLASPMVVLSRGWLRRHRPAVVVTAAALGAAVLIVLLAAVAYHVSPSTVAQDYELDIEETENVEVPLGHRVIEAELETSRPLKADVSDTVAEPPRTKEVVRGEGQARAADVGILVPRVEVEDGPQHAAEAGAVLRDAVKSVRSPSRSRRHRTDDSSVAEPPALVDIPRNPQSLTSRQSPHFSLGDRDVTSLHRTNEGPLVDAEPNVVKVEASGNGQAKGLWKWATLPFHRTYDTELDDIGNSVSETIKLASGTHRPEEHERVHTVNSHARHQSKVTDSEPNILKSGRFESGTHQDSEENLVRTLKSWPFNVPLRQQEGLVTVIKIPGIIKRQKRSVKPESDVHDLNVVQKMRKSDGILGSLLRKLNRESFASKDKSSDFGVTRSDRRTQFRGKRNIYWGPFYDPSNRFAGESVEDRSSSSEEVSGNELSPFSWYYTPQMARGQPYEDPNLLYWSSQQPHPSTYRNAAPSGNPGYYPLYQPLPSYYWYEAPIGQPDFYRSRLYQDFASTQQRSRSYEEAGGEVSGPEEPHSQSRQMEKALETSVVAPLNISPELFARAMKSQTPTEFAKHLRELSETHMSNLRQALPDENRRRLDAFTSMLSAVDDESGDRPPSDSLLARSSEEDAVVPLPAIASSAADTNSQQQSAEEIQEQSEEKETESSESSSEEEASGRAAESGLQKAFSADGIIKLINILPSESLKKIIESLSAEALADVLKGLSREEINKIKYSLPPKKLEAIKKMFSPQELEEMRGKFGINSNVISTPENELPGADLSRGFGEQTATKASIENPEITTTSSGEMSASTSGPREQQQVDASSEESLDEDSSEGSPGASTYAPLTAVPEASTDAAPAVSQHPAEDAEPENEKARSFLRRNGTASIFQKQLRPGLLQQTMTAMNTPMAAAGMSQMAAQDQRVGREMDAGNPLDAILTGGAQPQRQQRVDPSDAILSTLIALAEDVHWIRLRLADSNTSLADVGRSSLLDEQLSAAQRAFLQHTAVSGRGLTRLDRERLAALPPGLADQLGPRQAGNSFPGVSATNYLTGVGGDYVGAVEVTASTAYTVTSPDLDATTPKTGAHGQHALTAKPGGIVPIPNTGIHFPSQTSGPAFEESAAHKTLDADQEEQQVHVVPVAMPALGQLGHVCVYGHQPPAPVWPPHSDTPPHAAAYASAVAFIPQPQPPPPPPHKQPGRPQDKIDIKDAPVLHHQQNVYNYYSGVAPVQVPFAGVPWPQLARHQTHQLAQPQLQSVFCGWLPHPPEAHLPPHYPGAWSKPYLGFRSDSQAGVGAASDPRQSADLQPQTMKADETGERQPTTAEVAMFTKKPSMEETPAARDSHSDEGKSEAGKALRDDQLLKQSQNGSTPAPRGESTLKQKPPVTVATTQRSSEWKPRHSVTTDGGPCCGETTDADDESERANLASEKLGTEARQQFASEVRPLQGTHAAILSGLSVTPTVPVLTSTDGQGTTNR